MSHAPSAIFPDSLVAEVRRLPGARHSFLRQLCQPDADVTRIALRRAVQALPDPVRGRVSDLLHSVDNRRFFQGFAELASLITLISTGWTALELSWPGPVIAMKRPDGRRADLVALAFVRSVRPTGEAAAVARLQDTLERVASDLRFGVFVRKWLPHDFDPEPVRQAVQIWLREVAAGAWEGRYAAYEDDAVSLEFGLTGESRASEDDDLVAFCVGPFAAARTVGVLESVVVRELDRLRMGAHGAAPVVVSCVSDQPWDLSRGYVRELLYGKPRWTTSATGGLWEAGLSAAREPCLFKDSLYKHVGGLMMLERPVGVPLAVSGRVYSNPFSQAAVGASDVGLAVLAQRRMDGSEPVIGWHEAQAPLVRLGAR